MKENVCDLLIEKCFRGHLRVIATLDYRFLRGGFMKRKYWWIILFVFLFAQGALAGPLQRIIKHGDTGSIIRLGRSTVAVFELEANPSTGYIWEPGLPEDGSVRIIGRQFLSSNKHVLGSSGVEKIYVVGKRKGNVALTFALKRAHARKEILKRLKFIIESEGRFLEKFEIPKLKFSTPNIDGIQRDGSTATYKSNNIESSSEGLPRSFNWCDIYGCTPIKDQEYCGACWAFSTTAVLENLIKFKDGQTVQLSEQYLLSCNSEGYDCSGGWWAHDYHQWKTSSGDWEAGAVSQVAEPYLAQKGICNAPYEKVAKILDWGYVGNANDLSTTDAIKQAIYEHGPVAAAICVNAAFSEYSGGIFNGPGCIQVNHGIVLVGWNDDGGYWILRNSFGPHWGEKGYMRIKYGVSNVGLGASWIDYQGGFTLPSSDPETSNSQSFGGCDARSR